MSTINEGIDLIVGADNVMSQVLVYSNKDKKSHWHPCIVLSAHNAIDRPFRLDVRTHDGRTFEDCAPECVRGTPASLNDWLKQETKDIQAHISAPVSSASQKIGAEQ